MKDKKETAKLICEKLKNSSIESTISLIPKELGSETIPFVGNVGKELGRLIVRDNFDWEGKFLKIWNESLSEKFDKFGVPDNFEIFCLLINALGEICKKDYRGAKKFVLEILETLNNWASVDTLAIRVVSKFAAQNQKETFSLMEKWIKSENKWIRRLAVATIPPYIRAKPAESNICLEFLDKVMKEEDRNVKKASGWALREVTKKDPEAVFEFLHKWAKVDDKNTRWIIREGMKKLPEKEQEKLKSLMGG